MRHRGAKTAMTLALSKPEAIDNLVSVDNAPVDAALNSTFANYVRGMKKIEEAGVTSISEADKILAEFEPVSLLFVSPPFSLSLPPFAHSEVGIYRR